MTRREFEIVLHEQTYIGVRLGLLKGQLVSFVIRLMWMHQGTDYCVARYDTAHGRPHRDLISVSGRLVQKDWLRGMSFAEAADHAIRDFKLNHTTYVQQFKKRSSRQGQARP